MNTLHSYAPKQSFIQYWQVMPKLIFFFLGIIQYCFTDVLTNFVSTNWSIDKAVILNQMGTYGIASVIGSLSFALIADKTKRHRLVLIACVVCYLIPTVALLFPSSGVQENRFSYFLVLTSLQKFFLAGTFPVTDAMVITALASNPTTSKAIFGRQRLFKSLAHLFAAFAFQSSSSSFEDVILQLGVLTIAIAMFSFLVHRYDPKIEHATEIEFKKEQLNYSSVVTGHEPILKGILRSTCDLFTDRRFIVLIIGVFIAGFNVSYFKLTSHFLLDNLFGADWNGIVSQSFLLSIVCEVLVIFFYNQLSQFVGTYWIWIVGHVVLIVRTLVYALLTPGENSKWVILLADLLKGISSGMLSLSIVHAASDLAADNIAATSQSIFHNYFGALSSISAHFIFNNQLTQIKSIVENVKVTYITTSILGVVSILIIEITTRLSSKPALNITTA